MIPPNMDHRTKKELMKQFKELSMAYTPEWRFNPDNPDIGTALACIFIEMFEQIIDRFNKTAYKNYISFLNMIDTKLLSIMPAEGYVTFKLSTGMKDGVHIKKETQVFSINEDTDERIIFETLSNVFVIPAKIMDIYGVYGKGDKIVSINSRQEDKHLKDDFYFFYPLEGKNIQERILMVAARDVLNIHGNTEIVLSFDHEDRDLAIKICKNLSNSQIAEWFYIDENRTASFKQITSTDNQIILQQKDKSCISLQEEEHIENRWIMCKLKNSIRAMDMDVSSIKIKTRNGNVLPDKILINDLEQNIENFYAFGERFSPYDTLYISSEEVLSKKGANVVLSIDFNIEKKDIENELPDKEINWKLIMKKSQFKEPEKFEISVAKVAWEYWNGNGWTRLFIKDEYDKMFYTEKGYAKKIQFQCPGDMEKTFVNAHDSYWIRVRVIKIENMFKTYGYYLVPFIKNIKLSYDYPTMQLPEKVLQKSNIKTYDLTKKINEGKEEVTLFPSINPGKPTVYIGFDDPPIGKPIKMFFSLHKNNFNEMPPLAWQYFSKTGNQKLWKNLNVFDETDHLKRSGMVTFIGAGDFEKKDLFGKERYWIRLIDVEGKYEDFNQTRSYPRIKNIFMNTVEVVQKETIEEERFFILSQEENKVCELLNKKIIHQEVWVNEYGSLNEEQIRQWIENKNFELELIKNEEGIIEEVWVKWKEVDSFITSDEEDRHYRIDTFEGKIYFGDGKNGKIPTAQDEESIKVKYSISQGSLGNVKPFAINSAASAIAYMDKIFNVYATSGGCDQESAENAVLRGPQKLRHLNKAVTNSDFENLVAQASRKIQKIKCISNVNYNKENEPGSITLVVLPMDYNGLSNHFYKLKEIIEDYLKGRMPSILTFSKKLYIVEAEYIEISVYAQLITENIEDCFELEQKTIFELNQLLNPINGNYSGCGWEIGEIPSKMMIYNYIKGIKKVKSIDKIHIEAHLINKERKQEIDMDILKNKEFAVVISGSHEINAIVK